MLLYRSIGWSGINRFKVKEEYRNLCDLLKSYLWVSFLAFFCVLMIVGTILLIQSLEISARMSMNIVIWIDSFYLNFCFVFAVISVLILISWLKMSKKLILNIINFIKQFFQPT